MNPIGFFLSAAVALSALDCYGLTTIKGEVDVDTITIVPNKSGDTISPQICFVSGEGPSCLPLFFNLPSVGIDELESAVVLLTEQSDKGFLVDLAYALTMTTADAGYAEKAAIDLIDSLADGKVITGFHHRGFGEDRTIYSDMSVFTHTVNTLARSLGAESSSSYWIIPNPAE